MNKQDYFNFFSSNPIRVKEPRKQYYERIGKLLGKSGRTVEEYYPAYLKEDGIAFLKEAAKHQAELKPLPFFGYNSTNFHQVLPLEPQPKTTLTTNTDCQSFTYQILYPNQFNKPVLAIDVKEIPENSVESFVKGYKIGSEQKDAYKSFDQGLHLVLPDVHVPFENIELLTNILIFMEDYSSKIKSFTILGDFLDMLALSKHEMNQVPMEGYSLGVEYEQGNQWLDLFDDTLQGNCKKNFLYGNHEARYFSHFKDINNSVFADVTPNPTKGLRLEERGYNVFEDWKEDYVQLGKLQIIHGFYLGVNPCRQHLTRMKCSSMFGHSHRISSYFEGDQASFNIGCLCDINSPGFAYASRYEKMNWQNGFALVNIDEIGNFQVEQITCINNKFSYAGKSYGK